MQIISYVPQVTFFDFCVGKLHQIMACTQVEAVELMPQVGIVWVEAGKVASQTEFSPKCGHRILLSLWLGACGGGTS